MITIVVFGGSKVGKTELIKTFLIPGTDVNSGFLPSLKLYSGDVINQDICSEHCFIYDSSDKKLTRALNLKFCKINEPDVVLLLYANDDAQSFDVAKEYYRMLNEHNFSKDVKKLLVTTKADLAAAVSEEDVREFVQANNLTRLRCSAKDNVGIKELFQAAVDVVTALPPRQFQNPNITSTAPSIKVQVPASILSHLLALLTDIVSALLFMTPHLAYSMYMSWQKGWPAQWPRYTVGRFAWLPAPEPLPTATHVKGVRPPRG